MSEHDIFVAQDISHDDEHIPLVPKQHTDDRAKRWWFHDLPQPVWVRSKTQMILDYAKDYAAILLATVWYLLGVCLPYQEQYFRLDDSDLNKPVVPNQIVPNHLAPVVFFALPLSFLIVFHIAFIRHKVDFHHMILAFFMANLISGIPTTTLWVLVGGLRPDFLEDDCLPDMNKVNHYNLRHNAWNDIVYYKPTEVCMKPFRKTIGFSFYTTPAFPSGHASGAFASWLFVGLYISAKIGAWKLSMGHVYKFAIMTASICLAICIGWTRVLDHQHTAIQIAVGTLLGIPGALLGYRLKYCGLFSIDAHIPNYYLWKTIK
jgi:membrane-associated phospholipid phosphatase